ncbi:hypothetical protein DMH12_14405 [Streptomyces sp. WAC 04229]|uniref:hypothetical protein n=1 Tax=Streptomyces sp. WAC 04229 TaxID=2203206 RepID=UPI000F73F94F|nr:hypothetical protein [Streptomyces sp. WAC 04229]RSN56497.1 hypothetical protein DMH12_14405 [Streptomyces sp. WAC 04229]
MRGILRATALTAAIGAAALLPSTAASATPGRAAAQGCVTDSGTEDFGRGEITVCVGDDGVRVTGHVEDLKPGGPFTGGDSACVAWYITWETASGTASSTSSMACPHFPGGEAYVEFAYDPTESEHGPENVTGVRDTSLTTIFM